MEIFRFMAKTQQNSKSVQNVYHLNTPNIYNINVYILIRNKTIFKIFIEEQQSFKPQPSILA